ncbi:sigma-54 dependent transcriptional regulator [Novosphingobium sp. fls2-241-R2A-195]|jgi:DNA-binding NtrC family response regulator|uniref:sigma-54 interaction domain-containing protein n=1 Tax=Novosphingobium sp. fls2-241-R2A-195 TaxID=3040296 RepID=UPI00254ECABE|nr:sigma-54 dependent transcriptional regulator [Novosphingobium sp. fls2-241-R2A-195]
MRDTILKFEVSALAIRARTFIFSDPRSKALLPLIARTAPSDATVMITGETGTGKELVARYVHQQSGRADRPFVAVNCGAFSETLAESELFGHERGSFTGATNAREGWFEAANGGTLFLDEVGDLPHSLQVKLLRVLQEREVVRIGARRPVSLDFRLIAATNVDLRAAVEAGKFREDLFYRLGVVTLPLLPLRERPADILPLARHFLGVYGEKSGAPAISLSPDAEDAVFHHAWPGNIRELENVIQRATLVAPGKFIEPEHLGLAAAVPGARTAGPAPVADAQGLDDIRSALSRLISFGEPQLLDRLIDLAVREAYALSNENQVRTAQALGVTRNVIRTYLKNAGLIGD